MSEDNGYRSTVDKLIDTAARRKEQEEIILENIQEYAKALNGVAATPNGEMVLKTFIKAMYVFRQKSGLDGMALVRATALSDFYMLYIRPHLDVTIRQNIES